MTHRYPYLADTASLLTVWPHSTRPGIDKLLIHEITQLSVLLPREKTSTLGRHLIFQIVK